MLLGLRGAALFTVLLVSITAALYAAGPVTKTVPLCNPPPPGILPPACLHASVDPTVRVPTSRWERIRGAITGEP